MLRRQLPVRSPVSAGGLLRASARLLGLGRSDRGRLGAVLRSRYGAREVVLTDSGTSALVLAMRLTARAGGAVALPAFSCIDLAAAAIRAGVRVRLYDVDPHTLSPDAADLARAVDRGVDAVVAAHLYGYPVDMREVLSIARAAGVPVIEDAAQAAGGTLDGRPLGDFGDLVVFSFGRGKGLSGGGGGALLARSEAWEVEVREAARRIGRSRGGARNVALAAAQWVLGRPMLYWLPSSVPWLHLGEMVYRPAREPGPLPDASATLVMNALELSDAELARRRRNAARVTDMSEGRSSVTVVRGVRGSAPGFLRLPVIDHGTRRADLRAGILHAYPGTLADQSVLAPFLCPGEAAGAGAAELGRKLFTIPTHGLVSRADLVRVRIWIGTHGVAAYPAQAAAAGARPGS